MADPKELEARYYAAFSARDFDSYDQFFTQDCEVVAPGGIALRGLDAIKAFDQGWTTAFPDAVITIEKQVTDGSTLVSRHRFAGTHTGTWRMPSGGIPPTGRRLDGPYAAWFEMEGDTFKSFHLYYDLLEILTELGLMPAASKA